MIFHDFSGLLDSLLVWSYPCREPQRVAYGTTDSAFNICNPYHLAGPPSVSGGIFISYANISLAGTKKPVADYAREGATFGTLAFCGAF